MTNDKLKEKVLLAVMRNTSLTHLANAALVDGEAFRMGSLARHAIDDLLAGFDSPMPRYKLVQAAQRRAEEQAAKQAELEAAILAEELGQSITAGGADEL